MINSLPPRPSPQGHSRTQYLSEDEGGAWLRESAFPGHRGQDRKPATGAAPRELEPDLNLVPRRQKKNVGGTNHPVPRRFLRSRLVTSSEKFRSVTRLLTLK